MPLLPPIPLYLTGVRNAATDALVNYHDADVPLGLLVQPLTRDYLNACNVYPWIGVDNGCFTRAGQDRFRLPDYLAMIREAVSRCGADSVLFATAPDVAFDWDRTRAIGVPVLPRIRATGAPAALVLQDGATPESVPWDELDAIFLGGSTAWKVGREARALVSEALRRGKWAHMGRVNSEARMRVAQSFGCGSVDGTQLLHTTDLARASFALLRLLRADPSRRRYAAKFDVLLDGLRSASVDARTRSIAALRAQRVLDLARDLATARTIDKGEEYRRILAVAAEHVARLERRPRRVVRRELEEFGEAMAVEDILGWLRSLLRDVQGQSEGSRVRRRNPPRAARASSPEPLFELDYARHPRRDFGSYYDAPIPPREARLYTARKKVGCVTWLGEKGTLLRVDPAYVSPREDNQFDRDQLGAVVAAVRAGHPIATTAPRADVMRIDAELVGEMQRAARAGRLDAYGPLRRAFSTGDETLDRFLADPAAAAERSGVRGAERKHWERQMWKSVRDAERRHGGDLGRLWARVRDGNHRLFGTLIAGAPHAWVRVDPHDPVVPRGRLK